MRIKQNKLEHKCKGELVAFEENSVVVQKIKRDSIEEDNVNLDDFIEDLREFCAAHQGEDVDIKLIARAETE